MTDGYISQIKLPNEETYDFRDRNLKVYTGSCSTAAGTAIKDVVTDGTFTLEKGAVLFVNFTNTNSAAVGSLKLKINGEADTNAKPIKYLVNGNNPANIPGAGYLRANQTYMFRYDGTNWVADLNYYTYSNDFANKIGHYNNILARKAIAAESLIVGDETGYEKVASGVTFNLAYPIVWCTGAVNANASNYANMFLQHYDRNIATGAKSGFTSTANKAIYLIVTIDGNIATIDSNIITDTLPSNDDGKVYISLGKLGAQSTGANYFFLYPVHPMFWYKNGAIREYGGGSSINNITRSGTTFTATRDDGSTFTFTQQDNAGITSVTIGATSPVQSSTSTAQTDSSASTTISLADAYGDTKNPYGAKAKNLVLAGPSSGSNAAPTFRTLVAADIPDLSWNKITSDKPTTLSGYGITNAVQYNGIDNDIGGSATAANAKSYWANNNKVPKGKVVFNYNSSGVEYTTLFSNNKNSYGSILRWGYQDTYIRILRAHPNQTTYSGWYTEDWEKISAGYADTAGNATSATSAGKWTTACNISISDSDGTNTGTAVSVDGSAAVTLKLPATIKADITGDAATVNGLTVQTAVPANAVFTDTNKYHTTGSWSGLTYTATAVNSADELKFTIPNKIQANWELNATSGNSPALLFTRDGTATDWKIFVTSGKLSFQSATNSSTWTERAYFKDNSGDFVATSFTGNGSALTNLNASNISSGTLNLARLGNQNANVVLAGPSSGSAAAPTFRELVAADIPDLSWSKITSGKPTTLSGYGITDAKIASGTITLGSNTISPVTAIDWDSTSKKLTCTINGTAAEVVTAATLRTDLGLSNALHFIGITSTTLTDGSTTNTLTEKSTGSLTKTTDFVDGDIVMDGDQLREYVWSGSAWRLLGITTSTAYTQPASTATNTWIAQVSQGTDGKITAITGSLDTSGTWTGDIAWGNITNKPIEFGAYNGALNSGGWATLGGTTTGDKLYIAYNNANASWNSGKFSSSLVFGCNDVKGLLDIYYNSPIVTFGGSSTANCTNNNPKWYFKLKATTGQTYTLPSSSATLVSADGANASGTWGINISGSAASVNYTLDATHKAYLMASQNAPTSTTTAQETYGDTLVYLTTNAGELSAKYLSINDGTTNSVEKVKLQWNSTDDSLDFVFT